MFSIFLETNNCPERNQKQCLCKILGGKQNVLWEMLKRHINQKVCIFQVNCKKAGKAAILLHDTYHISQDICWVHTVNIEHSMTIFGYCNYVFLSGLIRNKIEFPWIVKKPQGCMKEWTSIYPNFAAWTRFFVHL